MSSSIRGEPLAPEELGSAQISAQKSSKMNGYNPVSLKEGKRRISPSDEDDSDEGSSSAPTARSDSDESTTSSHNSSNKTRSQTIDVLQDGPSFLQDGSKWFADLAFALRRYAWGGLTARPSYCPDPLVVEANVVNIVEGAEVNARGAARAEDSDDEADEESQLRRPSPNLPPPPPSPSVVEPQSARTLCRNLSARPKMWAVRLLAWALRKVFRSAFTAIHLHNADVARNAMKQARAAHTSGSRTALIILPTHRSHADYLLLSYIFLGLGLPMPLIAAGDNLNMPVVGTLLSLAGAFFIKRNSGTPRYRAVLRAYLAEIAKSGAPLEFFVEGGRSRRGHVGRPKLGLLGMLIEMVRTGELDDAVLLPASLDYDVVPEGGGFAAEVMGAKKKAPESLLGTVKAFFEWLLWGKHYGAVYVGFADKVISVKSIIRTLQLEGTLPLSRHGAGSPAPGAPVVDANAFAHRLMKLPTPSVSGTPASSTLGNALPSSLSIFKGASNASLATFASSQDVMSDGEIITTYAGQLVVEAQRDAALVTWGGVAACALLMGQSSHPTTMDAIESRFHGTMKLLAESGFAHRMPHNFDRSAQVEAIVESLGGPDAARGDAAKRLCLRYAAAHVVWRLLPNCVAALAKSSPSKVSDHAQNEIHDWLAATFDTERRELPPAPPFSSSGPIQYSFRRAIRLDDPDEPSLEMATFADVTSQELSSLVAPIVEVLCAALDEFATWRFDVVLSEEDVTKRLGARLAASKYPEAAATLEVGCAVRAAVTRDVLARVALPAASPGGKPTWGYELKPASAARLTIGRNALGSVRPVAIAVAPLPEMD